MRVAILTFCSVPNGALTHKYTTLGPLSALAWKAFGKRHALPVLDTVPTHSAFDACWAKLDVLISALQRYDQVLWVDCDTIPLAIEAPGWLTKSSEYDVLVQCPQAYGNALGWSADVALKRMSFNSGVMLLRSKPIVSRWLEAAFAMRKSSLYQDIWTGVGEQEALWALTKSSFQDLSVGYTKDMQCHPAHPESNALCAHLYGDHSTELFDQKTCSAVFDDWADSIRFNRPAKTSLALLHWCSIQRRAATDPIDRGGPEQFLYDPVDFGIPVGFVR